MGSGFRVSLLSTLVLWQIVCTDNLSALNLCSSPKGGMVRVCLGLNHFYRGPQSTLLLRLCLEGLAS